MRNFIAISRLWTSIKNPIDDECSSLTLVYGQINNVEKAFGKFMPTAGNYFLQNGIHLQKGMINIMTE